METFNEIIKGEIPVLVDFYATWCGPCKAMSPVIESVSKELKGKARVIKIDIDKNRAAATQFNIQAVPTLLLFKKGEIVWRNSGAMDQNALMGQVKPFID